MKNLTATIPVGSTHSFASNQSGYSIPVEAPDAIKQELLQYLTSINPAVARYLQTEQCMRKIYNILSNIVMGSEAHEEQLLFIVDPLTGRSRIGAIFSRDNTAATWKYVADLNISGNLSDYLAVRAISGQVNIWSDTISTTNTNLSGRMTSINVNNIPPEIEYNSLPSYAAMPNQKAVNVALSEGTVCVAVPFDHNFSHATQSSYEMDMSTLDGPSNNFMTIPDPSSQAGAPDIQMNLQMDNPQDFRLLGSIEIYIPPTPINTGDTPASIGDVNLESVRFQDLRDGSSDFLSVPQTQRLTLTIKSTEQPVYYVSGTVRVQLPPYARVTALNFKVVNFAGTEKAFTNMPVYIRQIDPVYRSTFNNYKMITMIQGAIGKRNVTVSGAVSVEALPTSKVAQQVSLEPAGGFNPAVLDLFRGLMAAGAIRLAMTRSEYLAMVQELMGTAGREVVGHAAHIMGSASFLSTLKSWGKKIIGGVRKALPYVQRGLDLASQLGIAAPYAPLGMDEDDDQDGVATHQFAYASPTDQDGQDGQRKVAAWAAPSHVNHHGRRYAIYQEQEIDNMVEEGERVTNVAAQDANDLPGVAAFIVPGNDQGRPLSFFTDNMTHPWERHSLDNGEEYNEVPYYHDGMFTYIYTLDIRDPLPSAAMRYIEAGEDVVVCLIDYNTCTLTIFSTMAGFRPEEGLQLMDHRARQARGYHQMMIDRYRVAEARSRATYQAAQAQRRAHIARSSSGFAATVDNSATSPSPSVGTSCEDIFAALGIPHEEPELAQAAQLKTATCPWLGGEPEATLRSAIREVTGFASSTGEAPSVGTSGDLFEMAGITGDDDPEEVQESAAVPHLEQDAEDAERLTPNLIRKLVRASIRFQTTYKAPAFSIASTDVARMAIFMLVRQATEEAGGLPAGTAIAEPALLFMTRFPLPEQEYRPLPAIRPRQLTSRDPTLDKLPGAAMIRVNEFFYDFLTPDSCSGIYALLKEPRVSAVQTKEYYKYQTLAGTMAYYHNRAGDRMSTSYAMYITCLPDSVLNPAVDALSGDSYTGALLNLYVGREPNRVVEAGFTMSSVSGIVRGSPNASGSVTSKLKRLFECAHWTLTHKETEYTELWHYAFKELQDHKLWLYYTSVYPSDANLADALTTLRTVARVGIGIPDTEHAIIGMQDFESMQCGFGFLAIDGKEYKSRAERQRFFAAYTVTSSHFWDLDIFMTPTLQKYLQTRDNNKAIYLTDASGRVHAYWLDEAIKWTDEQAKSALSPEGYQLWKRKTEASGYTSESQLPDILKPMTKYRDATQHTFAGMSVKRAQGYVEQLKGYLDRGDQASYEAALAQIAHNHYIMSDQYREEKKAARKRLVEQQRAIIDQLREQKQQPAPQAGKVQANREMTTEDVKPMARSNLLDPPKKKKNPKAGPSPPVTAGGSPVPVKGLG